ncbi:MAG TPA: hypothetical protein VK551_08345, partial [Thermodesulfobacteriota bacterium]|nr:hypothetical protein [Thermodesulfobacteriota bacterium]
QVFFYCSVYGAEGCFFLEGSAVGWMEKGHSILQMMSPKSVGNIQAGTEIRSPGGGCHSKDRRTWKWVPVAWPFYEVKRRLRAKIEALRVEIKKIQESLCLLMRTL